MAPEIPAFLFIHNEGNKKMFGKIKKIFFTGVFGILYISFATQLIYTLFWVEGFENKMLAMGSLTLEWLILIAARYLSKRSSNSAQHATNYRRR